ncbi:trypsin-like peptidase domain-containing protein [Acetobacter ascendens]|uniref:Peptidase S1 domain-containing protein n=1 Tax=Acetobacter ascendens TaxID=481146 RepID=A0A1Y0V480_9PROT|nr:trypsin-like peptidase domain-containing protein [Acetobacter ascendens]ARW10886.1 hypothetical protein S101447_01824 [Acetobacter ascendens]
MDNEHTEIMRAVERFAATVTLPVLHEYAPDTVDQVGTGTLFDHAGRLMLVTARHIFDEIKPENLVIPSRDTTELHNIGQYNLYVADQPHIDLAIVEICNPLSIERARKSWRILTVNDTNIANTEGWFVLTGYPSEKGRKIGGLIGSSLLSLHTWRLPEAPSSATQPISPDLDQFFRYDTSAEMINGETGNVPHLGGCSGGPIWEYREPQEIIFWTVDQCVRVIGVQSSFNPSASYFRAQSWTYVFEMIKQLVDKHPIT